MRHQASTAAGRDHLDRRRLGARPEDASRSPGHRGDLRQRSRMVLRGTPLCRASPGRAPRRRVRREQRQWGIQHLFPRLRGAARVALRVAKAPRIERPAGVRLCAGTALVHVGETLRARSAGRASGRCLRSRWGGDARVRSLRCRARPAMRVASSRRSRRTADVRVRERSLECLGAALSGDAGWRVRALSDDSSALSMGAK